MTRGLTASWIGLGAACLVAVALTARWAASARHRAEAASAKHHLVLEQVGEIDRLRRELPPCLTGDAPNEAGGKGGLATRVQRVLAGIALPASAMVGVAPQGASLVGGTGTVAATMRREGDVVTLAPVTLPKLGEFLKQWQRQQPCWWVANLELTPEPLDPKADASTGLDWPLRAVLTFETLTLERSRGGP